MLGVGVSLRHLRGTTAIDAYKVAGFSPQLVLDYENSKFRVSGSTSTAPSVVTATRTGLATQLDASGNLVWNAHNLVTYSEDFDNAAWRKTNTTVTANNTTAPDGTLTADGLVENAVTGTHNAYIPFSVINGASYTAAVFIKAGIRNQVTLRLGDAAFGPDDAVFDLSNGSLSSGNGTISNFGNGWYLCTVSATSGGTAAVLNILPMTSSSFSYAGSDGSTSLKVWGAHAYRSDLGGMAPVPLTRRVAGSTTYVPTTSAAVYLPREEAYTYVSGSLVGPYYQKESDARTNLLHTTNALVTQTVTVTAVPHTLHFTGTGTVTLLGVSAAGPLVGTGTGENNRVSLTFTPTAGSLTLAVSGTVSDAQLVVGSTPGSYIPNLAASGTVTRSADSTTISAGNMPAYTNALSFQMEGLMTYAQSQLIDEVEFIRWQADINNRIPVVLDTRSPTTGTVRFGQVASGVADIVVSAISTYSPGINVPFNIASRHGSTFINGAVDGTALTANTTPTTLPDLSATTFDLAPTFNGFIKEFRVWADDIGDTGIAEAST